MLVLEWGIENTKGISTVYQIQTATSPKCKWENWIDAEIWYTSLLKCFLSRLSTLMWGMVAIPSLRLTASVCLSVHLSIRDILVSDENGLTYHHRLFTIR